MSQVIVLLALVFSALLAIGAAVLSDVLDKTIRDPEQVARTLHTEVIGTLPLMKNRRALASSSDSKTQDGKTMDDDFSGFGESVRTLRNSILLGSFERRYLSALLDRVRDEHQPRARTADPQLI